MLSSRDGSQFSFGGESGLLTRERFGRADQRKWKTMVRSSAGRSMKRVIVGALGCG